jgi:Flp pilus assembly protein TadG
VNAASGPVPERAVPAPGPAADRRSSASGAVSLEAVLVLPLLALLVSGLLEVAGVVRDVLVVHEAARVGARAAATSTGTAGVVRAARDAAPELTVRVEVDPASRRDGDLVRVSVSATRRLGPVTHQVRAVSVARVEPAVGTLGTAPPPAPSSDPP